MKPRVTTFPDVWLLNFICLCVYMAWMAEVSTDCLTKRPETLPVLASNGGALKKWCMHPWLSRGSERPGYLNSGPHDFTASTQPTVPSANPSWGFVHLRLSLGTPVLASLLTGYTDRRVGRYSRRRVTLECMTSRLVGRGWEGCTPWPIHCTVS